MFVRKGTIRKARGGANRRSTRRPRRNSNENISPLRRTVIEEEPLPGSSHNLDSINEFKSVKSVSVSYESTKDVSKILYSEPKVTVNRISSCSSFSPKHTEYVCKDSPAARSHTTTIIVSYYIYIICCKCGIHFNFQNV